MWRFFYKFYAATSLSNKKETIVFGIKGTLAF